MARGSVTKRVGKGGRVSWRVRYDVEGPDGARHQRGETRRTREEADALLVKRLGELRDGTYAPPAKETVGDYLDRWLAAAAARARPASLERYRAIVRLHLAPALGGVRLAQLTPARVEALLAAKRDAGLAPRTVGQIHAVLRLALAQAVRRGELPRNVAALVAPPRVEPAEVPTWTLAQLQAFLAATAGDELAALWRLAVTTGLRRGELLALRWADVDLAAGVLAVARTQTRDGAGGWTVGPPKTRAGARQVVLGPADVAALRAHQARQKARRLRLGPAWQELDLVFDRGDGAMLSGESLHQRFKRRARRGGLPAIPFHALRHAQATLLDEAGAAMAVRQRRLGHAAARQTLGYTHAELRQHRDTAQALEALLAGARAQSVPTAPPEEAAAG